MYVSYTFKAALYFLILGSPSNYSEYFEIDINDGTVKQKKAISRQQFKEITLTIQVTQT